VSLSQFILGFLAVTSVLSLILIVLKGLRPEFESTAIEWIQTFGKLRDEIRKLRQNEVGDWGTLLSGAIGVAKYLVDKRNERTAAKRTSPFSYLYAAASDAII
jgi:hypothetical protein